jgi:2-amino-4-hydroxy-6-hydroxymethyldihydropteridine diphosphokinase
MEVPVAIGLGSNVGDRLDVLQRAVNALKDQIMNLRVSNVYQTKPMYVSDQGMFLNMAAVGETTLSPRDFLLLLKGLEVSLGRVDRIRNGPRELDLDILTYGHLDYFFQFQDGKTLQIPHPRLTERGFVMIPLAEIDPNWPIIGKGTAHYFAENGDWNPEDCEIFGRIT